MCILTICRKGVHLDARVPRLRYTKIMMDQKLNGLFFSQESLSYKVNGAISLRSNQALEKGNLALHVCQNEQDVLYNRKAWEKHTLPLENWVLPWQKHTANIQRVFKTDRQKGAYSAASSILETDGLYTTDVDTLVGVFTADCLGILLIDPTVPLIGAVHSGWKGTVQAILIEMFEALKRNGFFHPQSLHLYFSPSLMPTSLEVGPEVIDQVQDMADKYQLDIKECILPGQKDRKYLDNQKVNMKMALAYQIPVQNLHGSNLDTKTNPYGFSYRRDGKQTGEHFSCGWIEELKK